jgi:hypothetical protein
VRQIFVGDGPRCGNQRLSNNLAAKKRFFPSGRVMAPKKVVFDRFQI